MKERPILFSGAMVRALLDGTKTQTRRAAKTEITMGRDSILAPHRGRKHAAAYLLPEHAADAVACCPYGRPGDRLWVREGFADLTATHGQSWERHNEATRRYERGTNPFIWYRADGDQPDVGDGAVNPEPWRPSIHMPRWASRITLEITSVRVERLRDISESDAKAEGIFPHIRGGWHWLEHDSSNLDDWNQFGYKTPRDAYFALWEAINGPGSVDANPWVWAIEFRRVAQ